MPILELILLLVIIGVVLWLVNSFIPMQPQIKTIMNVIVVIVVLLWIISLFFPGLSSVRIGR